MKHGDIRMGILLYGDRQLVSSDTELVANILRGKTFLSSRLIDLLIP